MIRCNSWSFTYAQQAFDKVNNVIVMHIQSVASDIAKVAKLQVVNDNILRVTSTPTNDFPKDTSLIIVYYGNSNNRFTTEQKADTVYFKTNTLTAKVSLNNGIVSLVKSKGESILHEKRTAEPKFTTSVFDGQPLYHIN